MALTDLRSPSGESTRLIYHGYSPSDEEVRMEHGKIHLRAIKVPPLYEMLDDTNKKVVKDFFSHPEFKWTSKEILSAPEAAKPLKLL